MELSGWGRFARARGEAARPERVSAVEAPDAGRVIARGQGRSYGDAATSAGGLVVLTERLDRFLAFDERTGMLRAEGGATMARVLDTFVPRGWFPVVTPGTKYVSLGGCAASDVHGKNHHRAGGFGAHVAELELVLADGSRARCSPANEADLFCATVGGMGLTGFVTEVTFRLRPIESAHVRVRHQRAGDLDESLRLLGDPACDDEYTVLWLDALARGRDLGRGVLMRGRHAAAAELPAKVTRPLRLENGRRRNLPIDFPAWVLSPTAVAAFNRIYFRRQAAKTAPFFADLNSFFYPLDRIGNWNRMYGSRGFVQYQCVLPHATSREGLRSLLETLSASRRPCFLAVLKRLGAEGCGLLSFPLAGHTLSLDLPAGDAELLPLLDRFDEIVLRHGGRVYLAKDARLGAESFRGMYPRLPEWRRVKARVDPHARFSSDLSRRLGVTP